MCLALLLLLACFMTRKDPVSVINDVYQFAVGNKAKITKNDAQWEVFLAEKDKKIDSLIIANHQLKKNQLPPTTTVVTTSPGLNVRSLPSPDSEVIARLSDGDTVDLLYKDNELLNLGGEVGYWVKVNYQDKSGFVFSNYLKHFIK